MRRYLPSSRTRSDVGITSPLGDQFIRDFTAQAQAIMLKLSTQFTDDLQTQGAKILQNQLLASQRDGAGNLGAGSEAGAIGGIGQLLSTGVRYLVGRPRTSSDSVETSRSIDASQFRVSSAQSAAEAQAALNKAARICEHKNTPER